MADATPDTQIGNQFILEDFEEVDEDNPVRITLEVKALELPEGQVTYNVGELLRDIVSNCEFNVFVEEVEDDGEVQGH
jgi:hypothetical protein